MLSSSYGFMGGNTIYKYNGNKWITAEHFQTIGEVEVCEIFSDRNIWVTKRNNTYLPELYHYNGYSWSKKNVPFGNQVTALAINKTGIGWYGGVQEIAYFNGSNWKFIPYPEGNNNIVQYLFASDDKAVWMLTHDKNLFHYNGATWKQYFKGKYVLSANFSDNKNGFVLVDSTLFVLLKNKFQIHSSEPFLNGINKIIQTKQNQFWGVGYQGLIVKYNGVRWEKLHSPTSEGLMNIQMLSENEGWAVGISGTIVHFSNENIYHKENDKFDFTIMRPANTQVLTDEEYGVSIEDLNEDGVKDIYTVRLYNSNRLFVNKSLINRSKLVYLNFEDEAEDRKASGLLGKTNKIALNKTQVGVSAADIDNDGDKDVYLTSLSGKNLLLINNGSGYFRNISENDLRATLDYGRSNCATWGDVDNDGDLDLFIANEEKSNKLFLNNGSGYFTDFTLPAGLVSNGTGMSAAFQDADNDGDLDLFVANWANHNLFYKNNFVPSGKLYFSNITNSSGLAGNFYDKTNCAVFADYDNDGLSDLFITNRRTPNRLYKNLGNLKFSDVSNQVVGSDSMYSYSALFSDYDNDGWLDLFVSNVGENIFYKNQAGKKLAKVNSPYTGILNEYNTGAAYGDIDNDGDIDIYAANYKNGESKIYLNLTDNKNYILIDVVGSQSNRDAIGAKLWLYESGHLGQKKYLKGFKEITSGSGYLSHSSLQVHFGTGIGKLFDLEVQFPKTGISKIFKSIKPGSIVNIIEESLIPAALSRTQKSFYRILNDPEKTRTSIKTLLVVVFCSISLFLGKKRYKWNMLWLTLLHIIGVLLFYFLLISFGYQSGIITYIVPFGAIILFLLLIHLLFERIVITAKIKKEKDAARDRIARDLHDDLASTISSSVIYAEALQRTISSKSVQTDELFGKIKKLLTDASNSVVDVVWMASPSNDKLIDLIMRLRLLVSDSCKTNKIKFNFNISNNLPEIPIKEEVKRGIYFAFKEAVTNMIKHAEASEVNLLVFYENYFLTIVLEDNGKGFESDKSRANILSPESQDYAILHGNGLKNIYKRAEEMGAVISIISKPNAGTKISMKLKMT